MLIITEPAAIDVVGLLSQACQQIGLCQRGDPRAFRGSDAAPESGVAVVHGGRLFGLFMDTEPSVQACVHKVISLFSGIGGLDLGMARSEPQLCHSLPSSNLPIAKGVPFHLPKPRICAPLVYAEISERPSLHVVQPNDNSCGRVATSQL